MVKKDKVSIILKTLKRLFPHAAIMLTYSNPWELLVAVILSAQCTDKMVNKVTKTLFQKYKTVEEYATADRKQLEKDIFQTGFYRMKAKHIQETAIILLKEYQGKVPRTMQELIALPGVGRKTANVVLGNAYGIVEGIAVDTHVRRLSRLFGLTTHTDPDKIEQDLINCIPRSEWLHCTYRMIEYGRMYCPARKHDHSKCPVSRLL